MKRLRFLLGTALLFSVLAPQAGAAPEAPPLPVNNYSAGVEGFYERYEEPDATVNTSATYGSATMGYEHVKNGFFSAFDIRFSEGKEDYKSDSGTLNGESALESDVRFRTGLDVAVWHGHLLPYVGLGWRYYFDEGKGLSTNTGALAYDRHISQFYIPIGSTYRFTSGNWTYAPNAEFDILANGRVNTHFSAIDQFLAPGNQEPNITNKQGFASGIGLRGEFMVGQQYQHFGWEAGPFVRYWNISDSSCVSTPNSAPGCLLEPHNTRLQTGVAARINF
jgi:hypothetical protein